MSFTKPTQPNVAGDTPAQYKVNIDGSINTILNSVYDNTIISTTGTSSAYAANVGLTAFTNNQVIKVVIHTDNVNAGCTINFDSLGAKSIRTLAGLNPLNGVLKAGMVAKLMYDGVNMVLLNPHQSFHGAMMAETAGAAQSIPNLNTTKVTFDTSVYDTDGIVDTVNNELVVPDGVTKVRFYAKVDFFTNDTTVGYRESFIRRLIYSVDFYGNATQRYVKPATAFMGPAFNNVSAVVLVAPGDVFEVAVSQNSGGAVNVFGGRFFAMEIIE